MTRERRYCNNAITSASAIEVRKKMEHVKCVSFTADIGDFYNREERNSESYPRALRLLVPNEIIDRALDIFLTYAATRVRAP